MVDSGFWVVTQALRLFGISLEAHSHGVCCARWYLRRAEICWRATLSRVRTAQDRSKIAIMAKIVAHTMDDAYSTYIRNCVSCNLKPVRRMAFNASMKAMGFTAVVIGNVKYWAAA